MIKAELWLISKGLENKSWSVGADPVLYVSEIMATYAKDFEYRLQEKELLIEKLLNAIESASNRLDAFCIDEDTQAEIEDISNLLKGCL